MKRLFSCIFIILSLVQIIIARDQTAIAPVDSSQQPLAKSTVDAPIIWPTFDGYHQTGKINAGFNCNGTFGPSYNLVTPSWTGTGRVPGFVTPPDSNIEYLYGGAVWIGGIIGDDTLVTVGFDGWQNVHEFFPPDYESSNPIGSLNKISSIADYSLRCVFNDTITEGTGSYWMGLSHNPLNLKVSLRSHSWNDHPKNNCIIYDMVITNIGDETINSGYVAFYFDCDVGSEPNSAYLDDLTGTLLPQKIGYIIDNDGDLNVLSEPATRLFAFKFLDNSFKGNTSTFNWWIGNGDPSRDFGPRQRGTPEHPFRDFGTGGIGTPEGDANKYYMMSFPEWDYDQIYTYSIPDNDSIWLAPNPATDADFSDGYDTRFLMSIGPFNLGADSSVRILFTTFTGDYVHTAFGDANYLPAEPETFLSLLYFGDVLDNAVVADSLANLLLDPMLPPLGLEVAKRYDDSVELQWDAWAYDDVNAYELYLSEITYDSLPYPGAIPPWWGPDEFAPPILIPRTHRYTVAGLNPDKRYAASIAHLVGLTTGQLSDPVHINVTPRDAAPIIPSNYAFANPGGSVKLYWTTEDKFNIDHINIYKFSDLNSASQAYHAFYDRGGYTQYFQADDSFFVNDEWYYFYSMEPYSVMDATDTAFFDESGIEGDVYLIASADQYGFESEFTVPITANEVDEMTRDVLLITNSPVVTVLNYTYEDSIYLFYNKLLQGLDYAIYDFRDSTTAALCPTQSVDCMDWHDFMSFKLVVVDDRYTERLFSDAYQKETDGFARYLAYGGKLAYFGKFGAVLPLNLVGYPSYTSTEDDFVSEYLGIDSIMYGGERYYSSYTTPPYVDTLFGFSLAQSMGAILPSIPFDFGRDPFRSRLRNYWTPDTPPGVATFKLNENAQPMQLFSSIYPAQSWQQDHIVGVRRNFPELDTYAYTFGFHLWYMDSALAKDLIETILLSSPSSLSAQTNIFPQWYNVIEAYSFEPNYADIYFGNIAQTNSVTDIELGSISVNSSISPASIETIDSWPGYNGSVLKFVVPVRQLLGSYGAVFDTHHTTYSVSGEMTDGMPFQAIGNITIVGKISRDYNLDGVVNIIDLNLLVNYIFREQPLPEGYVEETMEPDGVVNILDLNDLVNSIFRTN